MKDLDSKVRAVMKKERENSHKINRLETQMEKLFIEIEKLKQEKDNV